MRPTCPNWQISMLTVWMDDNSSDSESEENGMPALADQEDRPDDLSMRACRNASLSLNCRNNFRIQTFERNPNLRQNQKFLKIEVL